MKEGKEWTLSLLIGLVLCIYGLNIPVVSTTVLLTAVMATLGQLALKGEYCRAFADRLLLLTLFALSYYLSTGIHGITGFKEGARNIAMVVGCYALGFSALPARGGERDSEVTWMLLLMLSGFVTFSLLCVYTLVQSAGLAELMERTAPNFWDGSEINAPGLGANASLGLCLLSVILFGEAKRGRRRGSVLAALVILVLVAAGVYVNAVLQNRTPFLALAASLGLAGVLFWRAHRGDPARIARRFAAMGGLFGCGLLYLLNTVDFTQVNIIVRFTEQRLDTPRYKAWSTMFASLHQSLLGGREVRLGEGIIYVHNLWLDVIWDAGIVPLIFLLAFHLKHAACFRDLVRSDLAPNTVLLIAGLAVSFFMNFMQEPTMSASVPYFAASCFFFGLVLRLSVDGPGSVAHRG